VGACGSLCCHTLRSSTPPGFTHPFRIYPPLQNLPDSPTPFRIYPPLPHLVLSTWVNGPMGTWDPGPAWVPGPSCGPLAWVPPMGPWAHGSMGPWSMVPSTNNHLFFMNAVSTSAANQKRLGTYLKGHGTYLKVWGPI
jgi:hypothetical protein